MKSVLSGDRLHKTVSELIGFYGSQFEMVCPPLNTPLILFEHVRDLGLPGKHKTKYYLLLLMIVVEIYPAAIRLAKLLDIDFCWPVTTKKLQGVSAYPELQLMCLIIIATKLSNPFDDIDRFPEDDSDPSIVRIDWSKWVRTMEERPSRGLKRGDEIKVSDTDVWSMNAKKMDDYLDWYQRTWIDDRDPKSMSPDFSLFSRQN